MLAFGKLALTHGFFEDEAGDAVLCGAGGVQELQFGPDDRRAGDGDGDERRGIDAAEIGLDAHRRDFRVAVETKCRWGASYSERANQIFPSCFFKRSADTCSGPAGACTYVGAESEAGENV